MTLRLRIDNGIQYELFDDPSKEREPVLYVWFSQDVSTQVRSVALGSNASGSVKPFDIQVPTLSEQQIIDGIPLIERIQRANLNIDVFSRLYNKHGQSCRNQSGSVRIPVYELLDPTTNTSVRRYTLTIPSWGDPNANGANRDKDVVNEKGWIEFSSPVTITLDGAAIPPLDTTSAAYLREVRLKQDSIFRHYMGSTVAFCRKLGYRWPVIKDINSYV